MFFGLSGLGNLCMRAAKNLFFFDFYFFLKSVKIPIITEFMYFFLNLLFSKSTKIPVKHGNYVFLGI